MAEESLILEIHWYQNQLNMSLCGKHDIAETVKHYTRCPVSFEHAVPVCSEIAEILNRNDDGRNSGRLEQLRKNGSLLWDQLLTPTVKAALSAIPRANLSLLLDEELVFIPWELLFDGHDFLCLKFNMGRLISTRSQRPPVLRSVSGKIRMLVLANPTSDLHSAYEEGLNIRRQFERNREQLGVDFKSTSIDTLFVKRSLREYDIVHFAGHCEYDREDPSRTGWLLTDGRFTCRDILAMAGGLPLPSIIFSNSCDSAQVMNRQPEDDYQKKTYSLASAFLFAGVRHYLGVVRKVEDCAGFSFSKEFYSRLLRGAAIGEAVREARIALIEKSSIENMAWAGYIVYGDPGFVLLQKRSDPVEAKAAAMRRWLKLRVPAIFTALLAVLMVSAGLLWLTPAGRFSLVKCKGLLKAGRNEEAARICAALVKSKRHLPETHLLMADALARMGRKDEAIQQCYDYILMVGDRNPSQSAEACVRIGWLYQEKGEYPKAFEFYDRALREARASRDKLVESTALRKMAVWCMDKQEDNKALELLTKSLEINRERQHLPQHRYNMACDYFDMGLVFMNKNELETAREFYSKSLAMFDRLNLGHEKSDCYFNLGEIHALEKQYHAALDCYMKGLGIDIASGNKASIVQDYIMIGELYAEMERGDEAEAYFLKSMALAREISDLPALASALYNLGLICKKKPDGTASAREYLSKAQEIYRSIDTPEFSKVSAALEELAEKN